MGKNVFTVICLIIISLLIIAGCSREAKITKLKNVEKFDFYSKGRLDNVLIVGKPRVEKNRKNFEDHFSRTLKRRGTDAIPSYKIISDIQNLNRGNIKDAAVKVQAGAVLATRVVGVDNKDVTMPQKTRVDIYTSARGGTVMMGPFIEGPYVENVTMVRLETGLFETNTEKMIWKASSKILNPDTVNEAIKDFSKAILNQLQQDGYVR
ncbi:MAG: hypothetical protein HF978_01760 [Desulfobacteraceae bacterium]|nr:hypothetical protein [Desulfobacteraceae bacterium]MBC2754249.1 hypothetical protein [Desulfobacteraceae bacterium]